METIQYAFKVLAYLGGLLVIFELLPKERRTRIEDRANALLTWRLLWGTLLIAVGAHVVFRLFPYISPFALLVVFVIGSLVLSLVTMSSMQSGGPTESSFSPWLVLAAVAALAFLLMLYSLS